MKVFLILFTFFIVITSCDQPGPKAVPAKRTVNQEWVDSVIKNSDSSYSKPYKRPDFVNAYFYINKKDSSVCQLMKDSSGAIRQILITRGNTRTFFARYFENGQLQADLLLDEMGQYHGAAAYYFPDGRVESEGEYRYGFKAGIWKNYDAMGKLISQDEFDSHGALLRTTGKN